MKLLHADISAAEQTLQDVLSKEVPDDADDLDLFLSWEKLTGKPSMQLRVLHHG